MKFTYTLRDQKTGSFIKDGSFESDQPYYEIAHILNDVDITKGSVSAVFTDANNRSAEYTVVKKNPKFIKSEYNGFPRSYLDDMTKLEPRYLTCVNPEFNNYKFYQIEIKNGRTHVQYGRIGDDNGRFGVREYDYDLDMYWVKYFEKISKGYVDQSELKTFKEVTPTVASKTTELMDIKNENIKDIVDLLISRQRAYVAKNYAYTKGNTGFSMKAIEKVNRLLDDMQNMLKDDGNFKAGKSVEYKQKMYEVISILPRLIDNVNLYVENSMLRPQATIDREKDLVDALKAIVEHDMAAQTNQDKDKTILDKLNLKMEPVTFDEKLTVQQKMTNKVGCVDRIIKVTNGKTDKAFKECLKEKGIEKRGIELLFHGSRTENWWSIISNGMSLNPNAIVTGKMFGQGLYFAPKAEKSMGYTDRAGSFWAKGNDDKGFLALYEVAMGKPYHPHRALGSNFRGRDLAHGCHSVYARAADTGLRNDEAIVYDERQCNIKYLIEVGRDRSYPFTIDIQNLSPKSYTFGTPYTPDAGKPYVIRFPIAKMTAAGKTELSKITSAEKDLYLEWDLYGSTAAEGTLKLKSEKISRELNAGDKDFFLDRIKDHLCKTCKLERTEDGMKLFWENNARQEFTLPSSAAGKVKFKEAPKKASKEKVSDEKDETEEMSFEDYMKAISLNLREAIGETVEEEETLEER